MYVRITAPNGAYGASTAVDAGRTLILNNEGGYPVRVKFDGAASPAVLLEPYGSAGAVIVVNYVNASEAPTAVELYAEGGASDVVVTSLPQALAFVPVSGGGGSGVSLSNNVALALAAAAAAGTAETASRSDHVHPLPVDATLPSDLAAAASAGVATVLSRADHVHALPFDATLPSPLAATAAAGVAVKAARVDHQHIRPTVVGSEAAKLYDLGVLASAGTTNVHAGFAGNDASNNFPGPFTNPDGPRNVRVTFAGAWDGGDVTVTGTDQYGNAVSEVIANNPGATVEGVKIFATVTAATKAAVGAAADTASIGAGNKLGLVVVQGNDEALGTSGVARGFVGAAMDVGTVDFNYDAVDMTGTSAVPAGISAVQILVNIQHNHSLS